MISLFTNIYNRLFDSPTYKILIIGMDGAGKTTLLNKLKQLAQMEYLPPTKITKTIGLNLTTISYKQKNQYDLWSNNYKVLYWDLGGSYTQRVIWKKYYGECHGIIFMIDSSTRLDEFNECFSTFLSDQTHDQVPILILLNQKNNEKIITKSEIQKLCLNQIRDINIQEINIHNNINVIESIKILHQNIYQLFQQYN